MRRTLFFTSVLCCVVFVSVRKSEVGFTLVEVFSTSPRTGTRLGVSGRSRTLDPGGISATVAPVSFTGTPVYIVTHQLD